MIIDFDNAFLNHIKKVYPNTYFANTALVYNVAYSLADADTLGFKLTFPLISIFRPSGFELVDTQNFAAKRLGYEVTDDLFTLRNVRFLTANLPYQIDIYAKTFEELNNLTEDILQYLNFEPRLLVDQSNEALGVEYKEHYDITIQGGINELSEFQNDDRVYHYAIVYEIKNARIINFSGVTPKITDIDTSPQTDEETGINTGIKVGIKNTNKLYDVD